MAKKALLLFTKKSVDSSLAYPVDLARLLNENGDLEVASALFEDLLFSIDEQNAGIYDTANNRSLTEYSVVYFRYWGDAQGLALAAARFCKMKNIPFVDSEVFRQGSFNKITQYMNLHEAGVPFPKTLVGPADALLTQYKDHGFSFPLILKSASGTRGQDNFLVQNEHDMRDVLQKNGHLTFVLQTFLPNDGDYRVVVMGSQVVLAIKRTASSDTHLNNTSQGGLATIVPVTSLPEAVRELSVRAATFFGRQIAGVDMVQSSADGRWYCFEVNRSPQIEHASFEKEKAAALATYLKSIAN